MTAEMPEVTPNQDQGSYRTSKWLVILVWGLGMAILAMVVVIGVKMVSMLTKDEPEALGQAATVATQALAVPAAPAANYLLLIDPPKDAEFVDMAGGGADAILRFRHGDGSWTLVIFDARKGVERGRVQVK